MRLLELGLHLVAGYFVLSLFVGLSVIHTQPEGEQPSWSKERSSFDCALIGAASASTRFFPTYGTNKFARQCGWTNSWKIDNERNCTFLARPWPGTNERLSDWVPQIVSGYLLAIQKGCRLYFDYGEGIDIHQVLTPLSSSINWTVSRWMCVSRAVLPNQSSISKWERVSQ